MQQSPFSTSFKCKSTQLITNNNKKYNLKLNLMNFLKKSIFVLSAVALTFGFASCSDDDDNTPQDYTKTVWTVNEVSSDIKLVETEEGAEADDAATIEAIEAKLAESNSILESVTLYSNGVYESKVKGGEEEGTYKLTKDSLFLTVKSTMDQIGSTAKNRAYGIKLSEETKTMQLSENLTDEFIEEFPTVEHVIAIFDAEGVTSLVAEPYK